MGAAKQVVVALRALTPIYRLFELVVLFEANPLPQ